MGGVNLSVRPRENPTSTTCLSEKACGPSTPTAYRSSVNRKGRMEPSTSDILQSAMYELTADSTNSKQDNETTTDQVNVDNEIASTSDTAAASHGVKRKGNVERMFSTDPEEVDNQKKAKRFKIGGERYGYVKRFMGRPYVNIREYYWNMNKTRLLAGKKGLNLTPEEWMMLAGQSADITKALGIV